MNQPPIKGFAASPWLLAAVASSAILSALMATRDRPAWQQVQAEYAQANAGFELGLRAMPARVSPGTAADSQEYCSSCHLAGAGYEPLQDEPFAAHADVWHDPLELGCTPCHKGDPGALELHEGAAYGMDAPLPGSLAWAACLHCHDPATSPEAFAPWPALVQARAELAASLEGGGCAGCHRIGGRGGLVGPDLLDFGQRVVADPTAPYDCALGWAQQQLEDPHALQQAARMPTPDLDSEQRQLLAAWLSLLGHLQRDQQEGWQPTAPGAALDAERLYATFCGACHGPSGGGRERGRAPGAVPALASTLWLSYTSEELLRQVLSQGRPGSLMEGFASDEPGREPILEPAELDALLELLHSGALAPQPGAASEAPGSCELCHFQRSEYLDLPDPLALSEHPWTWDLDAWLQDEGFETGDCQLPADGEAAATHSGEQLYTSLCVHCHEDSQLGPVGNEPAAPVLRGALQREHFDAAYLLGSVVIGRPDAAPIKWRHQGITAGEYGAQQLACLVSWLEANP